MGSTLAGSAIAVDPGHGPIGGGVTAGGLVEAPIVADVSAALVGELERRGARAVLLRGWDEDPDVSDRARRANAADAAVCVSVHLGGGELAPAGAVCCYYGTPSTHSPMGLRLAESIRTELLALGLPDGGVRPLAIAILRETRMPAVQIELAVLTDAKDAERAADPGFAEEAAVAIARGIEGFLGQGGAAPSTGAGA
jgi:N-acetylmuramoyl-L-alanine amidase